MHHSRYLNSKWIFWITIILNVSKLNLSYSAAPETGLQTQNQMPFLLSTLKHVINPQAELQKPSKRTFKKINKKQYDVINLLWRKLKLFHDVENTTVSNNQVQELTTRIIQASMENDFRPKPQVSDYYPDKYKPHQHVQQVETISISRMFPMECPDPFAHRQNNLLQDPLLILPVRKSTSNIHSTFYQHIGATHKPGPYISRKKFTTSYPLRGLMTTTISSIEFDYFAQKEIDSKSKEKHSISNRDANQFKIRSTAPRFHIKAEGMVPPFKIKYQADIKRSRVQKPRPQVTQSPTALISTMKSDISHNSTTTTTSPDTIQPTNLVDNSTNLVDNSTNLVVTTTESDKIKFFEMYDSPNVHHTFEETQFYDKYNSKKEYDYEKSDVKEEKVLLKHVDLDSSHNKHSNDTIIKIDKREFKADDSHVYVNNNMINNKLTFLRTKAPESTSKQTTSTTSTRKPAVSKVTKPVRKSRNNSKRALWSDYPFVAVYVHDPSQVHCDAAAISPRWLVAAAACLHRHKLEVHPGDFRTAFVAYCSVNWRQPKSIVYVKRVHIHPEFQPYDEKRRVLFNIGVIRVINAMSLTCPGWSASSFLTHQFLTEPGGTPAVAVGWGLDRYGSRYSSQDLPTWPLMEYKAYIHTDSCPGNTEYQGLFQLEDPGRIDTFCLSLPPYLLENVDPIHGSMLIVGGKLSALYLQEERRAFGEQSAIYTGLWRLVPWVMDTARETEEPDSILSIECL